MKANASFADVARRMTAWTSNLLATAVVAVLVLCIGRQLIIWYRVEPTVSPSPGALALADFDDGSGPLELEFGSLGYQLQRRVVRGSLDEANRALVDACGEHLSGAPLAELGPAESRLLALCEKQTPLARSPDGAELFAAIAGLPMVVATQPVSNDQPEDPAPPRAAPAGDPSAGQLGAPRRRVVTWGLATPAGADEWHLYIAHAPGERARGGAASDGRAPGDPAPGGGWRPAIPLPPGARRTLSIADGQGAGLSSIAGQGPASVWTAFYADWFRRRGWSATGSWRLEQDVWRARYELDGRSPTSDDGIAGQRTLVDIEIMPDGSSGMAGFLSVARAASPGGK